MCVSSLCLGLGLCASECQLQTDEEKRKQEKHFRRKFPAGKFAFYPRQLGGTNEKRREEKRERERDGREESGSYRQRRASRPARLTLLFLSTRQLDRRNGP